VQARGLQRLAAGRDARLTAVGPHSMSAVGRDHGRSASHDSLVMAQQVWQIALQHDRPEWFSGWFLRHISRGNRPRRGVKCFGVESTGALLQHVATRSEILT